MNFLRHNAKATAKCSRPCENIIRSFVNGGADVELARSQPAYGAFAPSDFFYGGPQRNFCRYGILSLYSLDRGDTRAFSGV